jgi:predicted membrane-bound spermidine synthase
MKSKFNPVILSVFFVSFSVIMFEISLTRIFSVILFYHYVFLIISLSILGLGIGGLGFHFWNQKRVNRDKNFPVLFLLGLTYVVVSILSVVVIIKFPVIGNVFFYFLITLLPFCFAGAFLAKVFRDWGDIAGKIYSADMIGAALGAISYIILINQIGAVNSAFSASGLALLGILPLAWTQPGAGSKLKFSSVAVSFMIMILLFSGIFGIFITEVPISKDVNKDQFYAMQSSFSNTDIIESRWSSFGRTDLLRFEEKSMMMGLFVDGAAGTPMYKFDGDISNAENRALLHLGLYSGFFPLRFLTENQKDSALSIGPGGGRDILLLLMAGVREVIGVEVNSDAVKIVEDYADYNGGLYTSIPNVTIEIEDGRNYIKRTNKQYDIIFLSLPVSKTGNSLNSFVLNESTLFTTDSILDYYDHLTPEGQLIVVAHNKIEIYKLVITINQALKSRGFSTKQVMERIMTAGPLMMPVLVFKKNAFTNEESTRIHQVIHPFKFSNEIMFIPHIEQESFELFDNLEGKEDMAMMNQIMVALSKEEVDLTGIEDNSKIDLKPPTDDRPFFYKFEPGLPEPLILLFWLTVAILFFIFYLPINQFKKTISSHSNLPKKPFTTIMIYMIFFLLLGAGYISIELALFHRFSIFLGKPAITLSIILFALLLGSGVGSFVSGKLVITRFKPLLITSVFVISGLVIIYQLGLGVLFKSFVNFDFQSRIILSSGLVMVIGFFMGFPFPYFIYNLKKLNFDDCIPWMWAVNGAASVLGAVLTIIIAISFGYSWVLYFGAGIYFLIGILFYLKNPN